MSVKIMSAVFDAQIPDQEYTDKKGKKSTVKSSTLKFILLALADHASDSGESVYPSIKYLKNKTSFCSEHTCVAAIGALEKLGILSHTNTRSKGNKEYRIALNAILELHPVQSSIAPSAMESSLTVIEPSVKDSNLEKMPKQLTEQQSIIHALCISMRRDEKIKRNINYAIGVYTAIKESPVHPTAELIMDKYGPDGWFYHNDWRGKKGEVPVMESICETWGRWNGEFIRMPENPIMQKRIQKIREAQ